MRRLSLKKLLFLFMAVSALMIICASAVMGLRYTRDLTDQNRSHAEAILDEFVKHVDNRLQVISDNLTQLSEKSSVISFVDMSSVDKMETAEYVRALLDSYTETEPSMQALYLCSREGILLQGHSGSGDTGNYRLLRAGYSVMQTLPLQERFRGVRYMRVYPDAEAHYKNDEYLLGIAIPVYGMDYYGALIALVDLSGIMKSVTDDAFGIYMTYDEKPMWSNRGAFTEEALFGEGMISQRCGVIPAAVYMTAESSRPIQSVMDFSRYNVPLILCVLIIEIAFLIVIYMWVVRQIENVAGQMELIGVDAASTSQRISVSTKSSSEIVLVARGVNGMLARLDELNRQVNQSELDLLNQRIMFLKSQINPHFLFNSLSSIRGMATMGSYDNIRLLTESIAQIYRYSMEESVMATVGEETECIRLYARTFEARYDSMVSIDCEIEAGLENAHIPRMILQPLAENAFLHAFAKKNFREGRLYVRCTSDGQRMKIVLENTGAQPDAAALLEMNSAQPSREKRRGIGIYNVRRRIELLGGEGAGLVYGISPDGGTQAVITFPKTI